MKSKTKVMISVIFVSIFILYIEVVGNFSEILSPRSGKPDHKAGEARASEHASEQACSRRGQVILTI